jgi:ribonuclease HII
MTGRNSDSPFLFDLPLKPDFSAETRLIKGGCKCVAGTDEAGRGPLAGPVVAAAVILKTDDLPDGIDDSKRLTKAGRGRAFEEIMRKAAAVAFASASAEEIDASNILRASLLAMGRAVAALCVAPDHVLADGRDVPPGLACPASALVKGDQRSLSVAAASIVAKVMRDRMMAVAHSDFQAYGFMTNQGYGSARHIEAIGAHGPVQRLHRFSFAPMKLP